MCITEEKLVDRYGESNLHERFMLIYKNYSVFPQLVDCYETGLFNRILYEREYNSTIRPGLEYKSPYDLVETEEMKKLLEVLNMSPVAADEICLNPKLLSKK